MSLASTYTSLDPPTHLWIILLRKNNREKKERKLTISPDSRNINNKKERGSFDLNSRIYMWRKPKCNVKSTTSQIQTPLFIANRNNWTCFKEEGIREWLRKLSRIFLTMPMAEISWFEAKCESPLFFPLCYADIIFVVTYCRYIFLPGPCCKRNTKEIFDSEKSHIAKKEITISCVCFLIQDIPWAS